MITLNFLSFMDLWHLKTAASSFLMPYLGPGGRTQRAISKQRIVCPGRVWNLRCLSPRLLFITTTVSCIELFSKNIPSIPIPEMLTFFAYFFLHETAFQMRQIIWYDQTNQPIGIVQTVSTTNAWREHCFPDLKCKRDLCTPFHPLPSSIQFPPPSRVSFHRCYVTCSSATYEYRSTWDYLILVSLDGDSH